MALRPIRGGTVQASTVVPNLHDHWGSHQDTRAREGGGRGDGGGPRAGAAPRDVKELLRNYEMSGKAIKGVVGSRKMWEQATPTAAEASGEHGRGVIGSTFGSFDTLIGIRDYSVIRGDGSVGLKEWIVPQERRFFDLLEHLAATVNDGALALQELLHDFQDVPAKRRQIKDIEHRGDDITHSVFEELNKTFITPIDREDIQSLASCQDNVLDMIDAAANRLLLYGVDRPTDAMVLLGDTIAQATALLLQAVGMIHNRKNGGEVERIALEVHRLENLADDLMNTSVASLFKEGDPIRIIKFKEITERLEQATDYCEDVANVLSDIVAKNQ